MNEPRLQSRENFDLPLDRHLVLCQFGVEAFGDRGLVGKLLVGGRQPTMGGVMVGSGLGVARALVTGANGFIGGALVRRLVADGISVTATSRRTARQPVDGVSWAIGDLTDPGFAEQVVARAEAPVLFHLAGEVTGSATSRWCCRRSGTR